MISLSFVWTRFMRTKTKPNGEKAIKKWREKETIARSRLYSSAHTSSVHTNMYGYVHECLMCMCSKTSSNGGNYLNRNHLDRYWVHRWHTRRFLFLLFEMHKIHSICGADCLFLRCQKIRGEREKNMEFDNKNINRSHRTEQRLAKDDRINDYSVWSLYLTFTRRENTTFFVCSLLSVSNFCIIIIMMIFFCCFFFVVSFTFRMDAKIAHSQL